MKHSLAALGMLFCAVATAPGCKHADLSCALFDPGCNPASILLYSTVSTLAMTAFSIPALGLVGTIQGTHISVVAPDVTSFSPMVAEFTTNAVDVRIADVVQQSGVTANNLTNNVIYSLRGQDGGVRDYTVTLTAPKTYGGGSLHFWIRADTLGLADGAQIGTWPDASGRGSERIFIRGARKQRERGADVFESRRGQRKTIRYHGRRPEHVYSGSQRRWF